MLTPIIAVVMTFSVLMTFTDFQLVYAITKGGPVNATHLMATLSFQRAITGGQLGEGAAIANAMIPFLLAAILFSYFGLQRRKWQARAEGTEAMAKPGAQMEGMEYLSSLPRRARHASICRCRSCSSCCSSRSIGWRRRPSSRTPSSTITRKYNPFWVVHPTLEHIKKLLFETSYPDWMLNTIIVSVASTVLSLFCSVCAAYAIERLRYSGSQYVGLAIFLAYLVPPSILFIPLATMVFQLGMFDSDLGADPDLPDLSHPVLHLAA